MGKKENSRVGINSNGFWGQNAFNRGYLKLIASNPDNPKAKAANFRLKELDFIDLIKKAKSPAMREAYTKQLEEWRAKELPKLNGEVAADTDTDTGTKPTDKAPVSAVSDNTSLGVNPESKGVEEAANKAREQSKTNNDTIANDSLDRFSNIGKAARATGKEVLGDILNYNFAKDGRHGNLNNMSGDETLAASRDVDTMNNLNKIPRSIDIRRVGDSTHAGSSIIHKDLNLTGDLETQETRQMRANERLDEKQKGTDIDLQAAVQKLDYDTFMKEMENRYGIEMNVAQAKIAMEAEAERQQLMAYLNKDKAMFDKMLEIGVAKKYVAMVKSLLAGGDNIAASIILYRLTGMAAPTQDSYLMSQYAQQLTKAAQDYGLSPTETQEFLQGMTRLNIGG